MDLGIVIRVHGAKLQAFEFRPELPEALLFENFRPLRGKLNSKGNGSQNRRKCQQQERTAKHIDSALYNDGQSLLRRLLRQTRIQLQIGWALGSILIPALGKDMRRDDDLRCSLRAYGIPQN